MAELPWYIHYHWLFLTGAIVLGAAIVGSVFGITQELARVWLGVDLEGRFSDPSSPAIWAPHGAAGKVAFLLLGLLVLFMWSWYRTFHRFREVVDALGDGVAEASVESPWTNATLLCRTMDGREFRLFYFGGSKYCKPYYDVWIEQPSAPRPFDTSRYLAAIPHLKDIKAEPGPSGGPWRLYASLSDEWLASETGDILRAVDALYEIRSAR